MPPYPSHFFFAYTMFENFDLESLVNLEQSSVFLQFIRLFGLRWTQFL